MSVVARWRSTFSSRITQFSLMSGFACSKAGDSFFSSIMSGLFNVAIVTVAAEAFNAAHATAPALTAFRADLRAGFMSCLLSRTLCDAAFVLPCVQGCFDEPLSTHPVAAVDIQSLRGDVVGVRRREKQCGASQIV